MGEKCRFVLSNYTLTFLKSALRSMKGLYYVNPSRYADFFPISPLVKEVILGLYNETEAPGWPSFSLSHSFCLSQSSFLSLSLALLMYIWLLKVPLGPYVKCLMKGIMHLK